MHKVSIKYIKSTIFTHISNATKINVVLRYSSQLKVNLNYKSDL